MPSLALPRPLSSRFAIAIAGTTAVNLASLLLTMLTGILLARSLGDAGRGLFAAVTAWYGIALVLGEWGQSAAATFRVAANPARAAITVASSRRLMAVSSGAIAVVGVLLSPALSSDLQQTEALRVIFASVAVSGLLGSYLYGLQAVSIRAWNMARFSQSLAYLVLVLIFVGMGRMTVLTAALAAVVSLLASLLLAFRLARRAGLAGSTGEREEVRWLASYGLRQSASAVPAGVVVGVDKVVLTAAVSPAELGHYAVAQTVVGTSGALGTAISSVAFPRLAGNSLDERRRRCREGQLMLITGLAVLVVASFLAAVSWWAIPLLYGQTFVDSVSLVWWFVPVAVFQNTSLLIGTILRGRALPGRAAWTQFAGLMVAGVALLVLVPRLGTEGAAVALGLGGATATLVGVLLWRRCVGELQ